MNSIVQLVNFKDYWRESIIQQWVAGRSCHPKTLCEICTGTPVKKFIDGYLYTKICLSCYSTGILNTMLNKRLEVCGIKMTIMAADSIGCSHKCYRCGKLYIFGWIG